jgi:pimeloyl-ACP methyl ester carboxylesterase
LRTLIVIPGTKDGWLGRAEEPLARGHRIVTLSGDASAPELMAAIETSGTEPVGLLARHDGIRQGVRLIERAGQKIAALVLESPPDLADNEALAEILPTIEIPVLVLYGTHDKTTPAELGRGYKALLPNA